MSQVNVLVAVDAQALAQQVSDKSLSAGTVNSPTNLGAWQSSDVYISMVAQHSVAVNEQGQSELRIKANSGDIVNWFMSTFGNNTDYTASLYAGTFNPSNGIQVFGNTTSEANNYLFDSEGNDSLNISKYINTYDSFEAKLTKVNQTIQYTLSFVLVDNNTGDTIGYFTWDPFINVA